VPSAFEVEMAIENLKGHKSSDIYKNPAQLIKAAGRTVYFEIHQCILFGIRSCMRSGMLPSLFLCIRRAMKQIVVIIEAYHVCQLYTKFYPTPCSQG
jgi:hypothetical protein